VLAVYLAVNGTTLFFDVDGEGLTPNGKIMRQKPTVIVVHGGPGADHSVSKPFFLGSQILRKSFTMTTVATVAVIRRPRSTGTLPNGATI